MSSRRSRRSHRTCRGRRHRATTRSALVLLALFASVLGAGFGASPAAAQARPSSPARPATPPPPPPPSLRNTPGFVDFGKLGADSKLDKEGKLTLRVSLYGPMLKMVAEFSQTQEPDFADVVSKLQGIFASIYKVPVADQDQVYRLARETAGRLATRGWQTVVEIHTDQGETSYIQVRTDGKRIFGLAVMFFEPDDGTAGFINVVGDVSPEEIGRLGRTFKIQALEHLDTGKAAGKKDTEKDKEKDKEKKP